MMVTKTSVRLFYILVYSVIAVSLAISYAPVKELMMNQAAFGFIMDSPLKLNMIILFGVWGAFYRQIFKTKNRYLSFLILLVGFLVIALAMRFMGGEGMKTIFG